MAMKACRSPVIWSSKGLVKKGGVLGGGVTFSEERIQLFLCMAEAIFAILIKLSTNYYLWYFVSPFGL